MSIERRSNYAEVMGWGVFLACSWTWCIGMFLPVILRRDFGVWAYAAFLIPNIVGAGAMGFVLRRRGASESMCAEHLPACRAFSWVTVAFQWFFLLWLAWGWGQGGIALVIGAVGLAWGAELLCGSERRWMALSACVFAISLGCGAWWIMSGGGKYAGAGLVPLHPGEVAWIVPVCVLGFGLCPYLDLTFHRARQKTPEGAAAAPFSIAFGALFPLLMQFTWMYTPEILEIAKSKGTSIGPQVASFPVAVHMAVQLGFTIAAHERELSARDRVGGVGRIGPLALALALLLVCWRMPRFSGMSSFELMYRGFLCFYALIFPAYVWVCVVCRRGMATRSGLAIVAGACVIAGPMYWMGFVRGVTWWLALGVGVVILAGLVARVMRSVGRQAGGAESA